MKYDNVSVVLNFNETDPDLILGRATIVVEENEGATEILMTITNPRFEQFLKSGRLMALSLGVQSVVPATQYVEETEREVVDGEMRKSNGLS